MWRFCNLIPKENFILQKMAPELLARRKGFAWNFNLLSCKWEFLAVVFSFLPIFSIYFNFFIFFCSSPRSPWFSFSNLVLTYEYSFRVNLFLPSSFSSSSTALSNFTQTQFLPNPLTHFLMRIFLFCLETRKFSYSLLFTITTSAQPLPPSYFLFFFFLYSFGFFTNLSPLVWTSQEEFFPLNLWLKVKSRELFVNVLKFRSPFFKMNRLF